MASQTSDYGLVVLIYDAWIVAGVTTIADTLEQE
jgi:hypothetical protein